MAAASTIYFAIPDADTPSGGVSVILEHVSLLQRGGYRAVPLVRKAHARYRFGFTGAHETLSFHHDPKLPAAWQPGSFLVRVRRAFALGLERLADRFRSSVTSYPRAWPQRGDIVVVPEFWCSSLDTIYPEPDRVMLMQGQSPMVSARPDYVRLPLIYGATIVTSRSTEALAKRLGLACVQFVPVAVGSGGGLKFTAQKRRQIAYMPRKRAEEVDVVIHLLRRSPELADYRFVPIDNMVWSQVAEVLNDSLFFLSFSDREGFGLPPAEAMLAGCIVIGYTGVGGAEYFDEDSGIVVPDSDFVGVIAAVEGAAREYEENPARLDQLRRRASDRIARDYSPERMRAALLAAWQSILAELTGDMERFRLTN